VRKKTVDARSEKWKKTVDARSEKRKKTVGARRDEMCSLDVPGGSLAV